MPTAVSTNSDKKTFDRTVYDISKNTKQTDSISTQKKRLIATYGSLFSSNKVGLLKTLGTAFYQNERLLLTWKLNVHKVNYRI